MTETETDGGWTKCVMLCINKFLDNPDHNSGNSPLVYGPCPECIKEHWLEKEQT